ncbi:hypothetical protein [Pukyongiella litopenaei]|uniref:hypothetical protein n=1 Tax=Pukyongiella litopenaei TaxID=2605946 RepID=UPI001B803696|nr:hypothetical protein [Pukyongiella litopenaei]
MSFDRTTHELHHRRRSRNIGLGLALAAFIALVFGLTVVKVTSGDFELPKAEELN